MSPDTSATCPPQAAGGPGGGGGDGREGPLSGLSLHREVVSELSLSQPEAATTAQLAEAVSAALEADARHAPLDAPRSRAYFLRGVPLDARRPPPQESLLAQIRAERAASGEALLWGEALRGGSPALEVLSPSRLHEVARGLRRRAEIERAAVRGEVPQIAAPGTLQGPSRTPSRCAARCRRSRRSQRRAPSARG